MMKHYAGIGSRITPPHILKLMTEIGVSLQALGFILRSGGAPGADSAFEEKVINKEVYVPWNGFQSKLLIYPIPSEAYTIAARHHPAFKHLSIPVKSLMARNAMQILGPNLDNKSKFVICWTPDGAISSTERSSITGGTGLAISVAEEFSVPVFNLNREDHLNRVLTLLNKQ